MRTLYLILYIVAAVCFALATVLTFHPPTTAPAATSRVNLIALGLLAWVLVPLIADAKAL